MSGKVVKLSSSGLRRLIEQVITKVNEDAFMFDDDDVEEDDKEIAEQADYALSELRDQFDTSELKAAYRLVKARLHVIAGYPASQANR